MARVGAGGTLLYAWIEMVTVVIACLVWGHLWLGKWTTIYSDNQSVGLAWAKIVSPYKGIVNPTRRNYFCAAPGTSTSACLTFLHFITQFLMHRFNFKISVSGNSPWTQAWGNSVDGGDQQIWQFNSAAPQTLLD